MFNSLQSHGLQHARPLCPSPTSVVYSNLCPLSQWCHSTISSSVVPFSCLESFPASGSFPMSLFFTSGGLSIGVSASATVIPMNIQDWSPLGWTGWISLQSKGLSRVFSKTTVQKHPLSTSGSWGKGLWSCFFISWSSVCFSLPSSESSGSSLMKRCLKEKGQDEDIQIQAVSQA